MSERGIIIMETNSFKQKNILESVVQIRNYFTGMSSDLDSILEMYRRSTFVDNFSSYSLMGGYMSHQNNRYMLPKNILVKRKYI